MADSNTHARQRRRSGRPRQPAVSELLENAQCAVQARSVVLSGAGTVYRHCALTHIFQLGAHDHATLRKVAQTRDGGHAVREPSHGSRRACGYANQCCPAACQTKPRTEEDRKRLLNSNSVWHRASSAAFAECSQANGKPAAYTFRLRQVRGDRVRQKDATP